MSVGHLPHHRARSALVIDRQRCYSAECLPSIAFEAAHIAETERQHRSWRPNLPTHHPQLQNPRALTASATRRTRSNRHSARHIPYPNSPRVPSPDAFGRRPRRLPALSQWAVVRNHSQTRTLRVCAWNGSSCPIPAIRLRLEDHRVGWLTTAHDLQVAWQAALSAFLPCGELPAIAVVVEAQKSDPVLKTTRNRGMRG
jgi:hypothetical protein